MRWTPLLKELPWFVVFAFAVLSVVGIDIYSNQLIGQIETIVTEIGRAEITRLSRITGEITIVATAFYVGVRSKIGDLQIRRSWIYSTPWRWPTVSPWGLPVPGKTELLWGMMLVGLSIYVGAPMHLWIILASAAYVYSQAISISSGYSLTACGLGFIGGLILVIGHNPILSILVACVGVTATIWAKRRQMMELPLYEEPLSASASGLGKWVQAQSPIRPAPALPIITRISIAIVLGWTVYVVMTAFTFMIHHIGPNPDDDDRITAHGANWILGFCSVFTLIYRIYTFHFADVLQMSPLGIRARVRTKQWLILKYDSGWLAPIALIFTGFFVGPKLLALVEFPEWMLAVLVTIQMLIATLAGPERTRWRLTAPCRFIIVEPPDPKPSVSPSAMVGRS